MKSRLFRAPRAMTAATWLVCGALLLTWLAAIAGITWITALDYLEYYEEKSGVYSAAMSLSGLSLAERSSFPHAVEEQIWRTLAYGSNQFYQVVAYNGDTYFTSDHSTDGRTAAAVYDGGGNLIACSGDFLFFSYDTEEDWEGAGIDSAMGRSGYTKVDVDMDALLETAQQVQTQLYGGEGRALTSSLFTIDTTALRFTGVFDGAQFHADRIEFILAREFKTALYTREPNEHYFEEDGTEVTRYEYAYSEVIRTENVPWHTLYDSGRQAEGAVTIYTTSPQVSHYDEGKPLTFQGERYDNLRSLLLSRGTAGEPRRRVSNGSVIDLIVLEKSLIHDYDNVTETADGGVIPAVKYTITTAVRCSPLASALAELKGLYIVTFLLAAALALAVCRTLRHRLIEPLQQVNEAVGEDFTWFVPHGADEEQWHEMGELYRHYTGIQGRLRDNRLELSRLNTALEYAKDAEQNRRQMVSHIAHEFKTPLAVIHSYAEGLKEHIAEGKREKYVDVILSETGRLDSMVLELLDLSRLEAGRVKLARDEFDLAALAREVFERLDMAARAKELRVTFDFPDACIVNADEARIRQVVENFAANAVKYTPAGGSVHAHLRADRFRTVERTSVTFSVENDSAPLSEEALGKVWDTFYRVDDSRTGGGTGLGLAIAKNIVELHGGKCAVRNTQTGVEFQFII